MTLLALPEARALASLTAEGRLLFATRAVRLSGYGALSVVLALYLAGLGLSEAGIGLLLTLALAGDAAVSLAVTAVADRLGRRRMLRLGAILMALGGAAFALTGDPVLLALAAVVGVVSPTGGEVGPFLPIEQAALAQAAPGRHRTGVFAWYNVAGYLAAALGALSGGAAAQALQAAGWSPVPSYRAVLVGYALLGLALWALFGRLSAAVEAPAAAEARVGARFGLHRSRGVVLRLSALFALDSFGGGLVVQSLVAYWLAVRFGAEPAALGAVFFGTNVLSGLSALAAARVAARFGLVNTMVWTHVPANVLLMLVPLMPSLPLALAALLARASLSQMDVPTRQSYTMAVVDPDERSATAGVTGVARSAGAALSPALSGALLGAGLLSLPFLLAGGLKIAYDLSLYAGFRHLKPPEETSGHAPAEPSSSPRRTA